VIQVFTLAKSYGDQKLFSNVSFTINKGERVGLVGRNGSGKSTIFKLILGEELADQGEILFPKNYKVAALKQHLSFSCHTVIEECLLALPHDDRDQKYRAEKILMGLGFSIDDMNKSPLDFSGGYQIRINLAKVLLSEPNCLLLDEPTNYLDILSTRWLAKFLQSFKGEIILVTHDRGFMNSVVTHTMGLWRGKLFKIAGKTNDFFEQIVLSEQLHEKNRQRTEKKKVELEEFINRFKAKASKAAQAQSRLKLLEKLPETEALEMIQSLSFEFNFKDCPGKLLLEAKDLSFDYGQGTLFEKLNFKISKGEKIGIIGKNGKGKSTLLNIIANELISKTGIIEKNINLSIGHFGQTNINRLDLNSTIEDEIASANTALNKERVRSICGTMMFSGDLAAKKINVLSGGERARVLLGRLLATPTNLLLLDEPTNHLDQDSIDSLILELKNYPGSAIIVSHSEDLLRQVADSLIVFQHNKAEFIAENYDGFLGKIGWAEENEDQNSKSKTSDKISRNEIKKLRSEMIIQRSKETTPFKKKIEQLEKAIIKHEENEKKWENELIDLTSSRGDSGTIQKISTDLGLVKKLIERDFDELTQATLEHDEILNKWEEKLRSLEDL